MVCKSEEGVSWFWVDDLKPDPWEGDLHPMRRVIPVTELFQHFVAELKESLWGDVYGRTHLFWQKFLEEESAKERDRYPGLKDYERVEARAEVGGVGGEWKNRTLRLFTQAARHHPRRSELDTRGRWAYGFCAEINLKSEIPVKTWQSR